MLLRKSRDGFTLNSFKSKCRGIPNTLIFIKTVNRNVFGGYHSQKWKYKDYDYDPYSLIFSIDKQTKFKSKNRGGANVGFAEYALHFG